MCSPVVSWSTVHLVTVLILINWWHMHSIDFVLVFPQVPVQTGIYMKLPRVPPDYRILDLPIPVDCYTKESTNCYGICMDEKMQGRPG